MTEVKELNDFLKRWELKVTKFYEDLWQTRNDLSRTLNHDEYTKEWRKVCFKFDLVKSDFMVIHYGKSGVAHIVKKDFINRKAKLYSRLVKFANVEDFIRMELTSGEAGDVNGYFYTANKTIKIQTIIAEGAIQKPHYRVLIKELKNK